MLNFLQIGVKIIVLDIFVVDTIDLKEILWYSNLRLKED